MRDRLVDAAKTLFLEHGYEAVSVRQIAKTAGVDHAMVNYYFGSKANLFGAAMALAATPHQIMVDALVRGRNETPAVRAELLVANVVRAWEDEGLRGPFVEMVRRAMSDDALRLSVVDFLRTEIITALAAHIGGADASRRAAGIGVALSGVIFSRYVMGVEPLASLSQRDLVRTVAPMVAVQLR